MITDEQIRKIQEDKIWMLYGNSGDIRGVIEFARELIALAQQVKPPEFVRIDKKTKKADTVFGPYFICAYVHETRFSFPEDKYYERKCETEAEAIAAANEDYQRRVLQCLVNGGV